MFVKGGLVLPAESPLLLWFSESCLKEQSFFCQTGMHTDSLNTGLDLQIFFSFRMLRLGIGLGLICMIGVSEITLNQHAPLTLSTLRRRLTNKGLNAALTTSSPWLSSSSSLLSKSSNLSFTTCRSGNISQSVITQCVVGDRLVVTSCSGTFHVSAKSNWWQMWLQYKKSTIRVDLIPITKLWPVFPTYYY